MRSYIADRTEEIADWILQTKGTLREAAKKFHVGKSTVHKDMRERLPFLDRNKAEKVQKILSVHLSERHLRGGEATKRKYGAPEGKTPHAVHR